MRRFFESLFLIAALLPGAATPGRAAAVPPGGAAAGALHTLTLADFTFDPAVAEPVLPTGWDHAAAAGPDLHLVQFDGPIAGDARDRLRAAGLVPVRYIHPGTFVVWGTRSSRETMRGSARVRWTGDFAPAFRVREALRARTSGDVDVRVLLFRGAGTDGVVAALSALGTPLGARTVVDDTLEIAAFRFRAALLRFAAAVPGVYSIQPLRGAWRARSELSDQINVDAFGEDGLPVPGYRAWLASTGLDGTGVTVAVVDEGVDESHPDLAAGHLPCVGPSCTVAPSVHGTHVAGIITGDGTTGTLDDGGFLRGLGVAPGTAYVEQEFVMFRFLAGGIAELIADSVRNGATISNNSWGTSSGAEGYDADTLMVDAGVRDGDRATPGHQPLFYVQAINNGNGGVSTQGAPEEAKNAFVVGSTRVTDNAGTPVADVNSVSDNSAHGPALDGRRMPLLVAPGCRVDSTVPDFGGGFEFQTLCGTSMAAPQVAAAAALFTQYYRGLPGSPGTPSPALLKAALLSRTHDLAGNTDADGTLLGHRPDSRQGWGRLDLPALVTPPQPVLYVDQDRVFDETGEEWLRDVTPAVAGQPVRIMLAWTDAPGHGLGGATPAWNNDLDLVVESGGQTFLGNVFGAGGWSAAGGAADFRNNAEGVMLAAPSGRITIRVRAANLTSDGVPNTGDDIDQDFALVCVNCAFAPGFDLDPAPVKRSVCAGAPASYRIDVNAHAGYAEPVTLTLAGAPAGASAAFDTNPVTPGAHASLTLDPGAAAPGTYAMTLHGVSADLQRTHPLYLALDTAAPVAAALSAPAPGATNVAPQPLLSWAAVSWATGYVVEVSTDPTFASIFYSAYTAAPLHKVGVALEEATVHHWRVRARNACGFGPFSATASFTTRDVPDILLVDDDWDYWGDYQPVYRAALDALGATYDVWDVYGQMQRAEPDYATLALYRKAIWWSGREDYYAGPTLFSEYDLARWFDRRGGCLLVSSPDYVYVRDGVSDFMRQRLGVQSVAQDTGMLQVTGTGAAFGGLGTIDLEEVAFDYTDAVTPAAGAELAFSGDQGPAGIDRHGGHYRTSFLGFGVERMTTATARQQTLARFLQWCDGLAPLDGDGDGVANGADCVPGDAGAWGPPAPVTDLRVTKTGFTWSPPASSSGAVYDLLRSGTPSDFWNATCLVSGLAATTAAASWDTDPAPGGIGYYLVRVRSACGTASLGTSSAGVPRQGTACP